MQIDHAFAVVRLIAFYWRWVTQFHKAQQRSMRRGFLHVNIACYTEPCISYNRVDCPSVSPSVTRWHWVKTTQARSSKSSPTDSPRDESGVGKIQNFQPISRHISETVHCMIRPKLLLTTNGMSSTPFRLVPKSTTLDDLDRPILSAVKM